LRGIALLFQHFSLSARSSLLLSLVSISASSLMDDLFIVFGIVSRSSFLDYGSYAVQVAVHDVAGYLATTFAYGLKDLEVLAVVPKTVIVERDY
jgi:non-ribosomal peptide synthetase component F